MPKTKKIVKADFPHIEGERLVKIWVKKPGHSFQLSIQGIGGRFYGAWGRKIDESTIGKELGSLNTVTKKANHVDTDDVFKRLARIEAALKKLA